MYNTPCGTHQRYPDRLPDTIWHLAKLSWPANIPHMVLTKAITVQHNSLFGILQTCYGTTKTIICETKYVFQDVSFCTQQSIQHPAGYLPPTARLYAYITLSVVEKTKQKRKRLLSLFWLQRGADCALLQVFPCCARMVCGTLIKFSDF